MVVGTRERILAATRELFAHQGYSGTGLKAVSAQAGAPFGSLYHHFPGGKQELAAEAIRTSGAAYEALVMSAYDAEATPTASLTAVFEGAAAVLEATDYADACPIATVALEVASTDDVLRQATADVFEQWTTALTRRLGDRQRSFAVLALLEGAFLLCRASRSTEPMHAAGRAAIALAA